MCFRGDEYRWTPVCCIIFFFENDFFKKGRVTQFLPMRCRGSLKRFLVTEKSQKAKAPFCCVAMYLRVTPETTAAISPKWGALGEDKGILTVAKQSEGTQTLEDHLWAEELIKPGLPYRRPFLLCNFINLCYEDSRVIIYFPLNPRRSWYNSFCPFLRCPLSQHCRGAKTKRGAQRQYVETRRTWDTMSAEIQVCHRPQSVCSFEDNALS